jgi:hypothetical protein
LRERFELKENHPEPLEQSEGSAVQSPHDPDAQYAAKGRGNQRKTWLGYKVQVAEALPEQSQPPFVVSIVTQKATGNDEPGLDQTLEAQAQSGLERPRELYVDGAYISGSRLQRAVQEGWTLMGPAPASPRRPGVEERLPVEAFNVDIAHRRACCPAGHPSGHCSRLGVRQKAGGVKVFYRFKWRQRCCQSCPLREFNAFRPAKSTAPSSWVSTMSFCSNVAKNKAAKPSSNACTGAMRLKAPLVN